MRKRIYAACLFILTVSLIDAQGFKDRYSGFQSGSIILNNGQLKAGSIKFQSASFSIIGTKPTSLKFKSGKNKVAKYDPNSIRGFTIGSDTFRLVKNIKINSAGGVFPKDFARQVLTGETDLLIHYSKSSSGQAIYYNETMILCNQIEKCTGVYSINKLRKDIAKYFKKDSVLTERILNEKKLTYPLLADLIMIYNQRALNGNYSDKN